MGRLRKETPVEVESIKAGETGYERLGGARLSLVDAVAQSVGFMGPVFSAAFVFPLIAGIVSASGKGAGITSPLAVLIAAVGVFALGWIVAGYARRIHAAGSLYDYVSQGLGERVGAATGWLYYSGTTILTSGLVVLIGGFLHDTLDAEFGAPIMPGWLWSLVVTAGLFLVLYLGVRLSTRAQLTLALVSTAVVGAFFLYVIAQLGGDNSLKPFDPSQAPDGWSGIFFGVLYGVLIFVGFETAANLGEETANPQREIPRAVLLTVVVVTLFYVVAAYTEVAGFGFSLETLSSAAAAPLFALGAPESAGGYGGTWIVRLLELVVLLDMLAVALGASVASTRGVFALARDRRIPAPLAAVSRRYGTPVGATVFLAAFTVLLIAVNELWDGLFALPETPHYFAMFSWCSTFGAFALIVVYLLLSVGALRGLGDGNRAGVVVAALVGIALTGAAIFGSIYKVTSPTVLAPWYALGWFALGIIVTLAVRGRAPARRVLPDLSTTAGE
jgi:amino acid transporter